MLQLNIVDRVAVDVAGVCVSKGHSAMFSFCMPQHVVEEGTMLRNKVSYIML